MKNIIVLITFILILSGCQSDEIFFNELDQEAQISFPSDTYDSKIDTASKVEENEILKLIDELVAKEKEGIVFDAHINSKEPFRFRYPTEDQRRVQQVIEKIAKYKKKAFPYLIDNLHRKEFSQMRVYAWYRSHSVGEICEIIISDQVDRVGIRYKSRKDKNGKGVHPNFFNDQWKGNLRKWWDVNKSKSLKELQFDCVSWRINREMRLGTYGYPKKWFTEYLNILRAEQNRILNET